MAQTVAQKMPINRIKPCVWHCGTFSPYIYTSIIETQLFKGSTQALSYARKMGDFVPQCHSDVFTWIDTCTFCGTRHKLLPQCHKDGDKLGIKKLPGTSGKEN